MPRYTFTGEILSPIHIGNGEELEAYEYLISGNRFYKVNFFQFISTLEADDQQRFFNASPPEQRQLIVNSSEVQQFAEYDAAVSQAARGLYADKVDRDTALLTLRQFIRTSNRPYIPGSSLKGAIRTAVLFSQLNTYPKERYADKVEGQALKSLNRWGRFDAFTDPFRCVKITDAMLTPEDIIIDAIRIDGMTAESDGTETVSLLTETAGKPYTGAKQTAETFNGRLIIDTALANTKAAKINLKLNLDRIVKASNTFANAIIDEELFDYFRFPEEPGHEFYRWLKGEGNGLKPQECLLRLGAGSGKYGMTMELKKDEPEFIKTRKLTSDGIPMGWVKLAFEELS